MMFFAVVTLITALSMAGIAAWFAIAGIMVLFAGAPIPALIMGSVVELGKIVGVSWIYRHQKAKTYLKYTMVPFVAVAVLLTSMGIFGFLSKAHLEQTAPVGNNIAKIERLDQRIAREQAKITDADTIINQLDEQVQVLIDYNKISDPVNGSRAVRAGQKPQRDELSLTIDEAQDSIDEYQDEKLVLSSELRQLELEVGPVKYIAEIIFEDGETNLERAVRIVIISFIFVFDPMAILLLMGANFQFMQLRGKEPDEPEPDDDDPSGTRVDDNSNPGEDLINLIDDTSSFTVDEVEKPVDSLTTSPKEVVKSYAKKDRAWLAEIPKKDENITGDILKTAMTKLSNRDLTADEKRLLTRLRKLATSRNVPFDVALRRDDLASVTTSNPILQK